MTKRKEFVLATITVIGTLLIMASIAEVVLRFLPVATGFATVQVTAENSVFHFTPNRDWVYSRDWDLALANRGRVNNAGFINDQDYRKDGDTPLLAVIGDSYIEAASVRYPETLQGRLANSLEGELRVYSFAASGAPLSQYLIWARHSVREYGATALVINVVGNDFDESLAVYKTGPGFWHYVPDANQVLHLQLFEYRRSILGRLVPASALGRYLVFHLQVSNAWTDLKGLLVGGLTRFLSSSPKFKTDSTTVLVGAPTRSAGNTSSNPDSARIKNSLAAIDAFFRDITDFVGLPPNRVLFTIDGMRYPEAVEAARGSYFEVMRRAFKSNAEALGYEVIDLDPLFFARYVTRGERFEHPRDGHWNATGHAVAAEAVMASKLIRQLRAR
jgi:hypothetical protein